MKSDRALAKKIIKIESNAIRAFLPRVDRKFERALDLLENADGRVVITGMGKPGLIGRKIAATLASTGTPSLFLHPAEAIHGDLGMVTKEDVVIAISNSGETEEITKLLSTIKKIGSKLIALTGNLKSTLAQHADIALDVSANSEACPWGLAPTASTAVALAVGDALALCLAKRKGFKSEDFAFLHPGGSLGKKLLRVKDIMRTGRAHAIVRESTTVEKALFAITSARAGSCSVINSKGKLVGFFTDGDLRRCLKKEGVQILAMRISKIATRKPTTILEDHLAAEAFQKLRDRKVDELPVVDHKGRSAGLLDVQDLLKAGVF